MCPEELEMKRFAIAMLCSSILAGTTALTARAASIRAASVDVTILSCSATESIPGGDIGVFAVTSCVTTLTTDGRCRILPGKSCSALLQDFLAGGFQITSAVSNAASAGESLPGTVYTLTRGH